MRVTGYENQKKCKLKFAKLTQSIVQEEDELRFWWKRPVRYLHHQDVAVVVYQQDQVFVARSGGKKQQWYMDQTLYGLSNLHSKECEKLLS